MDLKFILPFVAFAVGVGAFLLLTRRWWNVDERVNDRLNGLSDNLPRERVGKRSTASRLMQRTLPKLAAGLLPDNEERRSTLQSRLMQAGIYSPQALPAYQMATLILAIVPAVAALCCGHFEVLSLRATVLCVTLAGGCGFILPGFWLDRLRARRHTVLNRSLPNAIDLMVTCVEGGLSLEGAMQRVTDELRIAHPVLAGEMGVVQRQMEFGTSPDVAIQNFADRTGLDSIQTLSALMQQARRYGTGISEALRSHAEMIRAKREQLAEELAQKAAVKILFPTLLFIFPSIVVVLAGPAAIQLNDSFSKKDAPTKSARSAK